MFIRKHTIYILWSNWNDHRKKKLKCKQYSWLCCLCWNVFCHAYFYFMYEYNIIIIIFLYSCLASVLCQLLSECFGLTFIHELGVTVLTVHFCPVICCVFGYGNFESLASNFQRSKPQTDEQDIAHWPQIWFAYESHERKEKNMKIYDVRSLIEMMFSFLLLLLCPVWFVSSLLFGTSLVVRNFKKHMCKHNIYAHEQNKQKYIDKSTVNANNSQNWNDFSEGDIKRVVYLSLTLMSFNTRTNSLWRSGVREPKSPNAK